ncbi:TonB-dependent receptor [Haliscomenobacter sp.]|uniref:SusC/RagA family TonB-linked outer membrane protein n=1 Tax=Haliscomenobacter sp. TaxID=2717303 RepID=UPI0033652636
MKLALNERRSFTAQAIALWSFAMLSVLGLSLSNPIFARSPFSATTTVMVDGEIKGKVTADSGEPLIGASIKVKGTDQGTVTDIDGNFSLTVAVGAPVTLIISYVGYEEQIIKDFVATQSSNKLNISLKSTSTNLSTLVVTGYGTRAKRDLTGSVASVQAKDIKEQAVTSFDQALVGKMAGVQVIQTSGAPGGNVSIRIRGVSSISAGNNPLFVIDGIPVTNDTRSASGGVNGYEQPFNPLASLNPSDIESIDVLKDAASAAIYGSRGSGGVVLITTKKGKSGQLRINYDGSYGMQEVNKHVDVLDAYEYAQVVYDGHNNAYFDAVPTGKPTDPNSIRPVNPALRVPHQIAPYLAGQQGLTNTDWQNEIFRQAPMQSHTLSFSGGTDNITFLFSGSYLNQDGIVINNNLTRYNTRFRVDAKLNKFRFGVNMSPSFSTNRVVNSEGPWFAPVSGVIANSLGYAPIFPVYNPDGSFADSVNVWGYGQTNQLNPVAVANLTKDQIKNFRLLANTYGEYEIIDGLKYRLAVATDINTFRRDYYRPSNLPTQGAVGPSVSTGFSNTDQFANWLVENTLTYSKAFGSHKLDLLAGYSAQKENQDRNTLTSINFPTDAVSTLNAGQISSGSSTLQQWSLLSILGRAQYNYAGKYFLSVSARRDGSSRFGENNKWALFPSVSGAWDIAKENFFGNDGIINAFKIRASYGLTGNFQIPNYGSRAQLSNNNSNYVFGNSILNNGISITSPANDNLSWENTASTDFGVDISLFKSALNLTVDYYNSNTSKLLLNLPVPGGSGFSTYLQNIGEMNNKGLEVTLAYNKRLGTDFSIDGNINYSTNKNKVTKLGPSGAPIIQTGGTGNTYFITQIGETIASYFVYNVIGIYKDQADLDNSAKTSNTTKVGDFKFEDLNGDKKIDANDRKILGNFQPKYTFGFTNTFRYKNFDLNIAIQGSQGFKVMALLNRYFANVEGNFNNTSEVLGYYKSPSDPGTGLVNRANRLATGGNGITSSWHIEDGSYVRVRNLALGYTFNSEVLAKAKIASARIYVAVLNPITWSKYPYFNPEISDRPDNSLTTGEDYGSYPLARTYTFGVNFSF